MSDGKARAVAIGLSERSTRALEGILAEVGYTLAACADDGPSGLRLIQALQPELAIVGAVMPGMDGVAFARRLYDLQLSLRPATVLLKPPGLRLPGEADLPTLGATAMDAPPTSQGLREALARLEEWSRTLPPEKSARLNALLDALGVPEHPGRNCLSLAVALVWHDRRRLRTLKAGIYPELARRTGLTPAQAERAMRHAIDAAWRNGAIEQQHRIFGDTIDARRGKPTCGEMIAQLAEELRWEA